MSKIVIAIDPGYDRIGWAVGQVLSQQKINLLSYGLIQTNKTDKLTVRYQQIDQEFETLLTEFAPQEAALESLVFCHNQTTAMHVAEVRGLLLASLLRHQVIISEYSPPQIKLAAAGSGRADKKGVEKMVRLQLKLPAQEKIIDDTIDSLAILLTHVGQLKIT